ncbi:MAG: hypothetical protein JJU11_15830 [Candidatus Sumerlaeia bacterium]|nr:hypothetical protein [Candidatus Sumerlaeia bacterium]
MLLGLELGTYLGATVIFTGVDEGYFDTSVAGTLAGRFFQPVNIIGLFLLPAASLVVSIWTRAGHLGKAGWVAFGFLQVSLLLILVELTVITPGISNLRESLGAEFGTVGNAPDDHPDRQQFGMLHGFSMIRGLVQLVTTMVAFMLVSLTWRDRD